MAGADPGGPRPEHPPEPPCTPPLNAIFTRTSESEASDNAEAIVRQSDSIYRVHHGAVFVDPVDDVRYGRVARSFALFAYAGIGWAVAALALFGLADIL